MTEIQLQDEIQEGLITLLIHIGLLENREQPYVVITTSPSQWLPYCSSDKVTILDISELIGSIIWRVKADVKDRLIEKIRSCGWSDQQIVTDAQLSALMSRLHSYETDKIRGQIDIGLLGDNQQPIAVIGLYTDDVSIDKLSKEARFAANILNIPFAIITNGEHLLLIDAQSGNIQELTTFPSPQSLGLNAITTLEQPQLREDVEPIIVRCNTPNSFVEALTKAGKVTAILDYTLLGAWKTGKVAYIREFIPEPFRFTRLIDTYVAFLLLVVAQGFTNRLVSIVHRSFTNADTFAQARAYLASSMSLNGIIDLPTDFSSVIKVPLSILVLDSSKKNFSQKTAFLSLSNRGDIIQVIDQSWFSSVIGGLQGKPMKLGFQVEVKISDTWATAQHRPESHAAEERIKKITPTAPLGDLCHIIFGFRGTNKNVASGKEISVIRGRDLFSSELMIKDLDKLRIVSDIPEQVRVRQGDILIQRIGAPEKAKSIIVNAGLEGAIALDSVIILRPKEPENFSSSLIKQFLQSVVGRNLILMRTSGTAMISTNALKTIPIPIPSSDILTDLDKLQKLEDDLRLRADGIESIRLGLFNAESVDDFRDQLRALLQTAQAVATSMEQAESTEFQIRNLYPYPIVYSYRTSFSLIHPQDLYMEQLRIAENILAFLGSLILVLIPTEEYKIADLDLKSYWQKGISPGHWLEICRKGADHLRKNEDNNLSIALSSSLKGKKQTQLYKDLDKLVQIKNDFKHDRGPKVEEDFRSNTNPINDLLKNVMRGLSFLTESPIRLVRDIDLVRGTRRVTLKTLLYTGDHPGLRQEQCEYPEALKKGDLYIQLQANRWVPLFPYITVHNCSQCKTYETYFIDAWDGQKAKLKSFERGHIQVDNEIASELNSY